MELPENVKRKIEEDERIRETVRSKSRSLFIRLVADLRSYLLVGEALSLLVYLSGGFGAPASGTPFLALVVFVVLYGFGVAVLLALYLLPSIIAGKKGKKNTAAIFVLNAALGWTFVFWFVALIWSLTND